MSDQILIRMPTVSLYWYEVRDGDPLALAIFKRHYSYRPYKDGRREDLNNRNRDLFVGPGEKMVLVTINSNALFVWRKFISANGQQGVSCSVFRNEGKMTASILILEAELVARQRWPNERFYTYINAAKVRPSRTPGRCFRKAGWIPCGHTKGGLIILEKFTSATEVAC